MIKSLRILLYTLAVIIAALQPHAMLAQAPNYAANAPLINPQSFPGQVWTDLGNISPVEKNNIISATYAEQGIAVFRTDTVSFTPFVSVGVTEDTQGFPWDKRVVGQVGTRLSKLFITKTSFNGIIAASAAYSYEDRFGNQTKGGFVPEATYWFGWQSAAIKTSRFPGSTWGAAGWLSPVEYHNFVFVQYIKQAVVAKRLTKNSTVQPYGEITTSKDTQKFDWENYYRPGAGVEVVRNYGNTMTELGGGWLYEHRPLSGLTGNGYTVFMKFWFGWNPIIKGGTR